MTTNVHGSVLSASTTAGSVAVLPNTSGNKLALALTLASLTAGLAILAITASRALAAKIFNA